MIRILVGAAVISVISLGLVWVLGRIRRNNRGHF